MKTDERGLILDANIIVRAVLGSRVLQILERFGETAFYTPEARLGEAREHIPGICEKRKLDTVRLLSELDDVEKMLILVDNSSYADREHEARSRIRDPDDWPVVATALALELPIWTEDRDFFGCGIATWITNTVEIYLNN
jgi:predicted nucleic acid-binding protein